VAAIRAASPHARVGVATGLWITGDATTRRHVIADWAELAPDQRPDYASVNISETGWQDVAAILDEAGIAAEAGVWSVRDAATVAAHDPGDWLRILVEVSGVAAAEATFRADEILAQLSSAEITTPILLHGEDDGCWPLVAHAGRLGFPTRIGLEDVLTGPDGSRVADNAELVRLALVEWTAAPSG
jgi:uncharacterized protein (DUF849 family)